jgi:chitinase
MQKTYLAVSMLVFLVGCGAAPSGSVSDDGNVLDGQGEALTSSGTYTFGTLVHSGSCMDIAGASTADGAQIQEYACNGSAAQTFQTVALDSTYFRVVSPQSGKCLDVAANGTANGTKVDLYTCNGTSAQAFKFAASGSNYQIVGKQSGKCLDVTAASSANGTKVDLYTCNGTNAQLWSAISASGSPTPPPTTPPPVTPPPTTPPPSAGNFPGRFSAPYVPEWENTNLVNLANATGHKFFTLAFIINGSGSCNPTWNGDGAITGGNQGNYINALRAIGGDVIVSFGGEGGTEIGRSCTSVSSLQAAYQRVIDQYKLTWIDLDVENGAESEASSVDRRNKALHNLEAANPNLRVSYTLAVDRSGLPSAQQNLLRNAQSNGARVDVVNVMAMDYGACYTDMGQAAIDSASVTHNNLASLGIAASVGVTPMIGVNDTTCEVFSVANASQLVDYAQANSYIRLLAYWETGADNSSDSYLKTFHTFH